MRVRPQLRGPQTPPNLRFLPKGCWLSPPGALSPRDPVPVPRHSTCRNHTGCWSFKLPSRLHKVWNFASRGAARSRPAVSLSNTGTFRVPVAVHTETCTS